MCIHSSSDGSAKNPAIAALLRGHFWLVAFVLAAFLVATYYGIVGTGPCRGDPRSFYAAELRRVVVRAIEQGIISPEQYDGVDMHFSTQRILEILLTHGLIERSEAEDLGLLDTVSMNHLIIAFTRDGHVAIFTIDRLRGAVIVAQGPKNGVLGRVRSGNGEVDTMPTEDGPSD